MNNLQEQYNKLIKEYGEDRIVWIAAAGHAAYEQDSILGEPVTACYLPTEDELYNITPHNDLIDIRNIISLALDKDSSLLDTILTPYKIVNPKYTQYIDNDFFTYLKLIFLDNDEVVIKKLKNLIKNLIQMNFESNSKEQELINILTKTELKVLELIIKDFKNSNEGDIKVSQATEQYNISTSVFRTLFYKLKEYGVAAVDSRGVKGTHITFNNITNLKSLID